MAITCVVADDHPLFLAGLEQAFELEEEFQIAASCSSGVEAIAAVQMHRPDIAIMAMRMKDMSGLQAAKELRIDGPPTRFVLIGEHFTDIETIEALRIGVSGILLKTVAHAAVFQVLRKVYAGEQWVDHGAVMQAVTRLMRRETGTLELGKSLTRREMEVALLASRGLPNKEIADSLCLSDGTVKVHLHSIYDKLQVRNRIGLIRHFHEQGLAMEFSHAADASRVGAGDEVVAGLNWEGGRQLVRAVGD